MRSRARVDSLSRAVRPPPPPTAPSTAPAPLVAGRTPSRPPLPAACCRAVAPAWAAAHRPGRPPIPFPGSDDRCASPPAGSNPPLWRPPARRAHLREGAACGCDAICAPSSARHRPASRSAAAGLWPTAPAAQDASRAVDQKPIPLARGMRSRRFGRGTNPTAQLS